MKELFGEDSDDDRGKPPTHNEGKKKRKKPSNKQLFGDLSDDDGTPKKRKKHIDESKHDSLPDGKTPSGPRQSGRGGKKTMKGQGWADRKRPGTRKPSDREYAKQLGYPLPPKTAKEKRRTFSSIADRSQQKKQERRAARVMKMQAQRTPKKRDPKTGEFIKWAPMSPMKKHAKEPSPFSAASIFGA